MTTGRKKDEMNALTTVMKALFFFFYSRPAEVFTGSQQWT